MSYESDEASVEDGAPIELYEFLGSDLAVNTFRYTSADADVTFDPGGVGGSRLFTAIPIKRTGVELSQQGTDPTVTVTLPADSDLAARYVFQVAPPTLYLTIYRCHIGVGTEEVVIEWEGDVISWFAEENLTSFVIPNELVARVNETVPRVKYQPYCNNVLYDTICAVSKTGDNIHATTISSFSADGRTVNVASMGSNPSAWADGGEIIHDATGEARMILAQAGTALTIMYPFSVNVDTSEAVTLAVGCDHSLNDCVNKFEQPDGNQDNFTGMPFIITQALNPTQSGE